MKQKQLHAVKRAPMDRALTETTLEAAALRLLKKNGVLAGLNLREVAEEAGVNRGLVYHYYGSRRSLLRSALKKDAEKWLGKSTSGATLPFREQIVQMVRSLRGRGSTIRLATLLSLDDAEGPRFSPLKERRLADLKQEVDDGVIDPDTDLEALLILVSSLGNGYMTTRRGLSKEFKIPVTEMDERLYSILDQMLSVFERS